MLYSRPIYSEEIETSSADPASPAETTVLGGGVPASSGQEAGRPVSGVINPNGQHSGPEGATVLDYIFAELMKVLAGLFIAATAAAGAYIRYQTKRLIEVDHKLLGLREPAAIPINQTSNSVMVLGLGGTGKTSLIKAITKDPNADPVKATNEYSIYSATLQTPAEGSDICNIYMSDYVGQDLGSLIKAFIEQQKLPFSPMRYGYIDSLILVVDVVAPPLLADEEQPSQESVDEVRISANISAWSAQTLDAIFGMITSRLKCICLFINKSDGVNIDNDELSKLMIQQYEPLRHLLTLRARGTEFKTLVGSAKTGDSIQQLHDLLLRHAASRRS
jgi:hypothetical protein